MGMKYLFNQKYVHGDVAATLSAAGTTLATATEVTAAHSYVTTVAAGAGVKLSAVEAGKPWSVSNAGANALLLYPPTASFAFNGAAAGDPITIPVNGAAIGYFINATKINAVVGSGE